MSREIKDKDELSDLELKFIGVWFKNGFNGRKAYLVVKPNVLQSTADVESSRILRKPKVIKEIEKRKEYIKNREEIDLGFIVQELKHIIYDVKQEGLVKNAEGVVISRPDRNSVLKALDQLSKLAGLYTQKIDMTTQGETINDITINIVKPKE